MAARELAGAGLVALAALLWATDALFRYAAVESLDPTFIVFVEHLLGVIVLLPWIWTRRRSSFMKLGSRGWISAWIVGAGGSAIATVLFTASFRYVNPSVTILLQKLQPILVVVIAYFFLHEKPGRRFLAWALVAVAAAVVLSFPDLDFSFLKGGLTLRSTGLLYALASMALWAISTVAGKSLLGQVSADVATFWRFTLGLVTLTVLLALSGTGLPWTRLDGTTLQSLAYMSLVPGLLAMLAYYAGLERTRANVTTFVELIFPIGAVLLNWVYLHAALSPIQLGAGAVLLVAVTAISLP